jgi:copper resistance protein C
MMKTTMRDTTRDTPHLSNTTMIGTPDHMLVRMADVIGAQTMGTIAALMWDSIRESITTGMQCLAIVTINMVGLTNTSADLCVLEGCWGSLHQSETLNAATPKMGRCRNEDAPMSRLFTIAVLLVFGSMPAFAHAELNTTSPAADAILQSAPPEVAIEFSEAVEPKFSKIQVQDSKGLRVDKGDVHAAPTNPNRLTVGLAPLQPGTYKVTWRITSTDTHKTSGSFSFKIAAQ